MAGAGDFGIFYIVTALINAGTGIYNGIEQRKQQEEIAEKSRELTRSLEENRQQFQLSIHEKNAELQRELSLQNHTLRLREQEANFEKMCRQAEWQRFLEKWPLVNYPSVIRAEQILPDHTVSMRVIFSKSQDPVFSKAVYPQVEQGLRDFVDMYRNVFQSKNIIFYHNAFIGSVSGGAVDENIHYALKELPVIIIDTNVYVGEIIVDFTMWGFGGGDSTHFTAFRMPYEPHVANNYIDLDYYNGLSAKILAYLKLVLGYAYDAYNLIQYNRAPLLPKVAEKELELKIKGALLKEPEARTAISQRYGEIYEWVIGGKEIEGHLPYGCLPESYKQPVLYQLRLEYAEAVLGYVSDMRYMEYLDESVEAWVELRSGDPAREFLEALARNRDQFSVYIGSEDGAYLKRVSKAYHRLGSNSKYRPWIDEIVEGLDKYTLEECSRKQKSNTIPDNDKILPGNLSKNPRPAQRIKL